jgi:hypothetical protein
MDAEHADRVARIAGGSPGVCGRGRRLAQFKHHGTLGDRFDELGHRLLEHREGSADDGSGQFIQPGSISVFRVHLPASAQNLASAVPPVNGRRRVVAPAPIQVRAAPGLSSSDRITRPSPSAYKPGGSVVRNEARAAIAAYQPDRVCRPSRHCHTGSRGSARPNAVPRTICAAFSRPA